MEWREGYSKAFPHRITVDFVSLGRANADMPTTGGNPEDYGAMKAVTPQGYVAEPEGTVGTVVFLASRDICYIMGHYQRQLWACDVLIA